MRNLIKSEGKKGSILIWSVLLGFLLTSIFFYFSVRQRAAISVQRDTAEIINARNYMESYADYVEGLNITNLNNLKTSGISFDSITGTVTNSPAEIAGTADAGADENKYNFSGQVFIEWNKCSQSYKANLLINNVLFKHDLSSECALSQTGYDDIAGPIAVSGNLTVKTMDAPTVFRIKPQDSSTTLIDNKWSLNLKYTLDYGKVIEVKRSF